MALTAAAVQLTSCRLTWTAQQYTELPALTLSAGESLAVMGPSGCGKSTWLRWLLGVPQPHVDIGGRIRLAGQEVQHLPIEQRGIGLLMQDQALFPHYSVADNLAFALRRHSAQQAREILDEALEAVGLLHTKLKYPDQLSGGERARIGLLRAVLAAPKLILLDEPFNALDSERRTQVRDWTFDFLAKHQIPAIIVSHYAADLERAQQHWDWPAVQGGETP
ncbi:ATP-binding cassette domain-containing protein [Pseudidiomarina salilacus]|uniref:ATP-binding cassette domain-containing protein n=1 Tax=Pseudidiomarina salilacus TaxID=3384452 RepID=UPI003985221A